jgi:hypothetical protein
VGRARAGLVWQRTSDAIRSFVTQHGRSTPRRALFCTYEFDVTRFEAVLLPELTRRGRQFRTLVMVDSGALQVHLREAASRHFARYQVAPVRCRGGGVFHPKLVVLAAGSRRLVGVGSANLTRGGLGGNLELMLFAESDSETGEGLIAGAAGFLRAVVDRDILEIPSTAREFLRLVLAGLREGGDALMHSLDQPLLSWMGQQYRRARIGAVGRLHVLSPWHTPGSFEEATDPGVLRKVARTFGAPVTVYTDGQDGYGPRVGRDTTVCIRGQQLPDDGDIDEAPFSRRPTRVHAKAYVVQGGPSSLLFFGSANCTNRALILPSARGGNVELLVASKLTDAAWRALQKDLGDLFVPAQKFRNVPPERGPLRARGAILCGHLVETRAGRVLKVEAPRLRAGRVVIAARRQGPPVAVTIRKGLGEIGNPVLGRLFPKGNDAPARSGPFWGSVLWERVEHSWEPFPVFIPLVGACAGDADETLAEVLLEEIGSWPKEIRDGTNGKTDDARDIDTDDDKDVSALAEAHHQGKLDRLAVAISILRRRLLKGRLPPAYVHERLALLREGVVKQDIPHHWRRVVLRYLDEPNGRRRG